MNTLSRSVSKLSEQELRNLENDRIENFSDDEREGLAEAGLIVPGDIDEIALLREGFERSKRGRSHATITSDHIVLPHRPEGVSLQVL